MTSYYLLSQPSYENTPGSQLLSSRLQGTALM